MIYSVGSSAGVRCEDAWHLGMDYDPNKLLLTPEDKVLLKGMKIGF